MDAVVLLRVSYDEFRLDPDCCTSAVPEMEEIRDSLLSAEFWTSGVPLRLKLGRRGKHRHMPVTSLPWYRVSSHPYHQLRLMLRLKVQKTHRIRFKKNGPA